MNTLPNISPCHGTLISADVVNALIRRVNVLSNITFSGGVIGGIDSNGIRIGVAPTVNALGFPYGDKWIYGIDIYQGETVKINIWNPLVQRLGMTVTDWFGNYETYTGIPDKVCLEKTIAYADWEIVSGKARIYIGYTYDTTTNIGQLVASKTPSDISTLPANDASALDPMQVYKLPLYVLEGTDNTTSVDNVGIYIDLIHGLYTPQIMG